MFRTLASLLFAAAAAVAFASPGAVDVNKASQAELETVKGIGPGLSGRILEARHAASFKNWDNLVERVGGMGPGSATKLSKAGRTVAGANDGGPAAGATPTRAQAKDKAKDSAATARSVKAVKAVKATKTDATATTRVSR